MAEHLHSSFVLNKSQVNVFFPLKIATYKPVIRSKNSKSSETKPRGRQQKKAGTVLHVEHNSHPDVSLPMVQLLALHREPGYATKILPLSKENNLNITVSSIKENSNTLC